MNPGDRLRVARGLRVTCQSPSEFLLKSGQREICGGPYTLALLDAFRTPRSMNEVLADFRGRLTGAQDWMELTQQLLLLHRHGLLEDPAAVELEVRANPVAGFGSPAIHIQMLEDRERTQRFLRAIADVVKPGDVVVDLGTGSGVLAIAAAKAGARRVYAIEATNIADTARRAFAENGVADRISLIEGYSTQIQVPERADVLVSEIIGNEPLGERILETTADAVRRFLKPDAKLIPQRLRVQAFPVELPAKYRDRLRVSDDVLENWRHAYGVDFTALADLSRKSPASLQIKPAEITQWLALGDSHCVADFDLTLPSHPREAATAIVDCTRAGTLEALAIWFEADLGCGQLLATNPATYRPDNHWLHPVYVLAAPVKVQAGERIRLRIETSHSVHVSAEPVEA